MIIGKYLIKGYNLYVIDSETRVSTPCTDRKYVILLDHKIVFKGDKTEVIDTTGSKLYNAELYDQILATKRRGMILDDWYITQFTSINQNNKYEINALNIITGETKNTTSKYYINYIHRSPDLKKIMLVHKTVLYTKVAIVDNDNIIAILDQVDNFDWKSLQSDTHLMWKNNNELFGIITYGICVYNDYLDVYNCNMKRARRECLNHYGTGYTNGEQTLVLDGKLFIWDQKRMLTIDEDISAQDYDTNIIGYDYLNNSFVYDKP